MMLVIHFGMECTHRHRMLNFYQCMAYTVNHNFLVRSFVGHVWVGACNISWYMIYQLT